MSARESCYIRRRYQDIYDNSNVYYAHTIVYAWIMDVGNGYRSSYVVLFVSFQPKS